MRIILIIYLLLFISLNCKPRTNFIHPDANLMISLWNQFQANIIDQNSLLIGFSYELKHKAPPNEVILVIQSFVDNLDSISQMKFYVDNIFVRLITESKGLPQPPPKVDDVMPLDSSRNTYFYTILSQRKYNNDSVISYILNNKLKRCEVRAPHIRSYAKLLYILNKNNINNILDSVNTKKDYCSIRNGEDLKFSFKYILR